MMPSRARDKVKIEYNVSVIILLHNTMGTLLSPRQLRHAVAGAASEGK
jgi:hypothetical protein